MPLVDADNPATWEAAYTGGYGRANALKSIQADAAVLRQALPLEPKQTIVLIGAGFGYEAEEWQAAGLGPIVCCDTSKWIHKNKRKNARVPILDLSVRSEKDRAKLGTSDWVISLDSMPWLTDDEALDLAAGMRLVAPKVAHWISVSETDTTTTAGNWKPITAWKELLKPDIVVARGSREIA